ncbi:MAG: DUF6502 family protein [Gammaproteobacteria bacterium]
MSEPTTQTLTVAILRLLRPLVRILLRNGMPFHAFAELAKKVYVDVAFEEFGIPGRKQTISNVAVTTGLTRKEVKRLREAEIEESLEAGQRYNRAVRVISGWLHDPRFRTSEGEPAVLPVEEGENSFALLVKEYSGDMTTQAMLRALERAGSVEREDDRVRLVRRAFVPSDDPVDKLRILGTDVAELTDTIAHNLTAPPGQRRFQRKVSYDNIDPESLAECRLYTTEKAQALLETFEDWLIAHQVEDPDSQRKTVSVGIYYYEADTPEENSHG